MSNKLSSGIILASLIVSCGKERKIDGDKPVDSTTPAGKGETTNTPNGTIKLVDNLPYPCDAKVTGNIVYLKGSGFQVCSEQGGWQPLDLKGETGPQGPQGFTGPKGGSALVAVYDAKDRKLGWLMETVTSYGQYHILLTAGLSVRLLPNGFLYSIGQQPSQRDCYYELAGCTGSCRTNEPVVLAHSDNQYLIAGKSNLGAFSYTSISSSYSCLTTSGTIDSSYSTSQLVLASGAAYPFEGPISLKAE